MPFIPKKVKKKLLNAVDNVLVWEGGSEAKEHQEELYDNYKHLSATYKSKKKKEDEQGD